MLDQVELSTPSADSFWSQNNHSSISCCRNSASAGYRGTLSGLFEESFGCIQYLQDFLLRLPSSPNISVRIN